MRTLWGNRIVYIAHHPRNNTASTVAGKATVRMGKPEGRNPMAANSREDKTPADSLKKAYPQAGIVTLNGVASAHRGLRMEGGDATTPLG